MFQIITEVISVAARAPQPRSTAPLQEAPRRTLRSLIWRHLG